MGTITSGIGLISGLNTASIIDQLIAIESQPVTLLQSRITTATNQKTAYQDLITRLNDIKTISDDLAKPTTFEAATVSSSDTNTLTGTATNGAALGSYQFQVARLVTTQQSVSQG